MDSHVAPSAVASTDHVFVVESGSCLLVWSVTHQQSNTTTTQTKQNLKDTTVSDKTNAVQLLLLIGYMCVQCRLLSK